MTPLITPQELVNIPDDVIVIDVQHDLQDPFAGLVGPYHSPMEDGMLHFHEYLRKALATAR